MTEDYLISRLYKAIRIRKSVFCMAIDLSVLEKNPYVKGRSLNVLKNS